MKYKVIVQCELDCEADSEQILTEIIEKNRLHLNIGGGGKDGCFSVEAIKEKQKIISIEKIAELNVKRKRAIKL